MRESCFYELYRKLRVREEFKTPNQLIERPLCGRPGKRDWLFAMLTTGYSLRSWLDFTVVVADHTGRARSAPAVGSEAAMRFARRAILRCNQVGKDGFCGLYGRSWVDLIERKDRKNPHKQDIHYPQAFRSQTLYLLSCGSVWGYYSPGEISGNFTLFLSYRIISRGKRHVKR